MEKVDWKPGTMIYPLPAVMVSVGDDRANYNIITVAWTGTLCSDPPMCYVSVRRERHSHALLSRVGDFVINLTTRPLARATDWCGVRSGRDHDKFEAMGLTPAPAAVVKSPVIAESPVNIECVVKSVTELGSHDMFVAQVVNVKADARYIDPSTGEFRLADAQPIAYAHGHYYALGDRLGKFGFSVEKRKKQG